MAEAERYPIYARGLLPGDPHTRIMIPIFPERHQARTFIESFIGCDDHSRVGCFILMDPTFTLRCDELDRVMDAKLEGWELPSSYERMILRFKYGNYDGMRSKAEEPGTAITKRTPKVERERRPERPSGFVTIGDLCSASNVLPMHARAALRAAGLIKPDYGWAFDPKDVPRIKNICGMK